MKNLLAIKILALFLFVVLNSGHCIEEIDNSKSLEQVGVILHGGNPLAPILGSYLGQYLANTRARSVIRTFSHGPSGGQGPEKLAIPLSAESLSEFLRFFGAGNDLSKNLFFIVNIPKKSDFFRLYKGIVGGLQSFGQLLHLINGSLLIPILLDDQEAANLENIFHFVNLYPGHEKFIAYPWSLIGTQGRYSECPVKTGQIGWLGQLPIGKNRVHEYIFPTGDDGQNPLSEPLNDYITPRGMTVDAESRLRSIWMVPGYQQLGEILDPVGYRAGYFNTYAGWIAHIALGRLGLDRSPFMFYVVSDHQAPLPVDFPLGIVNGWR